MELDSARFVMPGAELLSPSAVTRVFLDCFETSSTINFTVLGSLYLKSARYLGGLQYGVSSSSLVSNVSVPIFLLD